MYHIMVVEYNTVILLNLPPKCWTIAQLKAVIKLHKTKDDPSMPTKKSNLYARYMEWKRQLALTFEDKVQEFIREKGLSPLLAEKEEEEEEEDGHGDEHEDCITAMLMMNQGAVHTTTEDFGQCKEL